VSPRPQPDADGVCEQGEAGGSKREFPTPSDDTKAGGTGTAGSGNAGQGNSGTGNAGTGSGAGTASDNTGNAAIDWDFVKRYIGWLKSVADLPADFSAKGRAVIAHSGNLKDLNFDLQHAGVLVKPYQSWSEVSFALAAIFKHDGRFSNEQIAAALLADLECSISRISAVQSSA
jgi:hypothetical protein